jgi:hypothetical protein
VPGVTVALWKQGTVACDCRGPKLTGGVATVDEVLDNAYSDADGWVHIPVRTSTAGELYVSVTDDDGNMTQDSLTVTDAATAVALNAAHVRTALSVTPSVLARGAAATISLARVQVTDARVTLASVDGRVVRTLTVQHGQSEVRWDGRDTAGHSVAAGVYFARSAAAPKGARLVVLR